MQGGQKRQPLGYTIVEVLIVLAVSSFMFLIAANFISGKQEKTAFTEGSNDTVTKLQQVLEDVTNGHYSDIPLTCSTSSGTIQITSGGTQGTNKDCIFLGKLVRFYAADGGDKVNYQVYSLAAARDITGSLPNAKVAAVSSLTTKGTISQNLSVGSMKVDGAHPTAFNIGFAQGLGTPDELASDTDTDTYMSGSQTVNLIYFSGTWGVNDVAGNYVKPAKSATLCLTDGTRSAQIFIGADPDAHNNSNDLSITLKQRGKQPCP
jgi:hypothetical protein